MDNEIFDIDKINRFTAHLQRFTSNEKVLRFYDELLSEIDIMHSYIDQVEMDNYQLHFHFLKEKDSRIQLQVFVSMLFYLSNSGKGSDTLVKMLNSIDRYFIKDEAYFDRMKNILKDGPTDQ